MKILLASSYPNLRHRLHSASGELDIDSVEYGEEIFQKLESGCYDCLIAEANLVDVDIWSIVRFINANINSKTDKRLPIFVIGNNHIKQPKLVTSNYQIKTLDLSDAIDVDALLNDYCVDKPAILIIEDDPDTANGMRITLQNEYDVDVFHTGKEGIVSWKKKKHDLVLLDLMLPGTSGEETLKEIRSLNPDQAIIIVSARSEVSVQQKLILLGANDYLTKPFTPQSLNKTCRVALTHALYQFELKMNDDKQNFIVNELCSAIDALDNEDTENAIDIINKIIYSMPDKMTSDDIMLSRKISRIAE